ncbi:PLP-dependent transferase [Rhizopogon vinicolor AM-OR11-026]|uniref:PLP-dependent transferase n=1 Tax=Rhizopogon vinicolor AM-OR11-026 TaxID=1314800 RepID=A0A1B7NAX7_9AGAM|nr:PLP-dependent transferase [Rhizopogon vinicolor AM-OR11-026]
MIPQSASGQLSGTQLIHGDHGPGSEVAPSISVTSTFRAVPDGDPEGVGAMNPGKHIYSRYSQNVTSRVEQILSKINQGHAITYASGLAAAFSILVHYKPKRIAITGGYMGCHGTISTYIKGRDTPLIGLDDEFQEGDLCWFESPLNPTGESRNIEYYADKIHAVGGKLLIDSTFGPPPLQYPFKWGADCVFHSGTKYFGGHSDLLCGIVIVRTEAEREELWHDRCYMGNMMGSLESWLLLRSLRTMHLRIPRQSASGTEIAQWLSKAVIPEGQEYDGIPGGVITKVWHSSLQETDARGFNPSVQMEGGFNACFAILLSTREYADKLPHSLEYFVPATSLGGVESLAEQRVKADPKENPLLVRLSIGVEEVEDLKDDLRRALILVHYKPKRIAITGGYMGCHGTISTYIKGRDTPLIGLDDEFQEGDLCWFESPLNPTGESRNIEYYADKIHAVGGKLLIDSTFGPPPLQYPFKWGADCIFHSGTKYFGGHSDLLCGIVIVRTEAEREELWHDRCYMGNMMGSLESWLLLRSLRTLHLRIPRQSASGTEIAQWLSKAVIPEGQEYDGIPGGVITKVWHSSLQETDARGFNPSVQMEGGFNACFSILLSTREYADKLPHSLEYFVPATSLGGVESLVEQRVRIDPKENPLLVRLSIGLEEVEDLKDDLRRALVSISKGN